MVHVRIRCSACGYFKTVNSLVKSARLFLAANSEELPIGVYLPSWLAVPRSLAYRLAARDGDSFARHGRPRGN